MKALFLFTRVAFRNVRRNTRRSLLTIFAIAFGLLCLIVFQSLKVGLHSEMVNSTIRLDTGTLQVHAAGYEVTHTSLTPIEEPQAAITALQDLGVTSFSPRLKASAIILTGQKSSAVLLSGVDPDREPRVTFIASRVMRGTYVSDGGGILVGDELAKGIGVDIGSEVTLITQDRPGLPRTAVFPVTGIYRTELASFDRSHVYLTLPAAQELLRAEGAVSEIAVRTEGRDDTRTADRLGRLLPAQRYQVKTWQEITPDVQQLIQLNEATMRLLILIVFTIIAMGIANTMTMAIFERFRELGILAAVGTPPSGILTMILMEAFLLGAIASIAGSVAALGACAYLAEYGIDLTRLTSANQYFATSHVLKAVLRPQDLLAANAVTLVTAIIGGIYPALKAARLRPAEAIIHT